LRIERADDGTEVTMTSTVLPAAVPDQGAGGIAGSAAPLG
jgi:hypothetical protein